MNSLLAEVVHAEWTKLRTVRSTAWLLATAVVLTVGVSAIAVSVVKCPASCTADTTKTSLTGVMVGQAIVAVLAVLVMSGEYSTGMIRATITAIPRRLVMLSAKAIILTGVVLVVAAVSVLGSLLAGRIFLPHNGFTRAAGFVPLSMYHGPTLRAAMGSVLYLGLIALFSLGVACSSSATPRQAVAQRRAMAQPGEGGLAIARQLGLRVSSEERRAPGRRRCSGTGRPRSRWRVSGRDTTPGRRKYVHRLRSR